MKRKKKSQGSSSSSSRKRRSHAARSKKTPRQNRRIQRKNTSVRLRRRIRFGSAKAAREAKSRHISQGKKTEATKRRDRRRVEADQRSRRASRESSKRKKRQRQKEKEATRDYLVEVEFYAHPAGAMNMKRYSKTVVVSAPAGEESGALPKVLRNYILDRAQVAMPRHVDKLITNQEWESASIHRGPISKPRKRVRSRR